MARTKSAGSPPVKRPSNWEKRVSAAYLLTQGYTKEQTAVQVGCSERVLYDWKNHHMWPDALAEARARWLQGVDLEAMAAIGDLVRGRNDKVVMWFGDRRIPELAPPKQRTEVSGPDGGPVVVVTPEQARERVLDKLKPKKGD